MNLPAPPRSVLIVCLGNICRSPTAEAVLRACAARAGIDIQIDSAGTANYHTGSEPDARSIRHAAKRGYSLRGLRARQVGSADFEKFDLILAADESNLADLRGMCPRAHAHKLRLFLENRALPDPYHGGAEGFEEVLDLVEARCAEMVAEWSEGGMETE